MENRENIFGKLSANALRRIGGYISPIKKESYDCLLLKPGDRVLDVGCGPGLDTIEMARLVKPGGQVVGVDTDAEMIQAAEAAAAEAGVSSLVEYRQGDAASLPYPEAYFDAYRCDRVLQYVPSPSTCLREMVRVLKPGGRIALLDSDHYSVCIDTPEIKIERQLVQFRADWFRNGSIGRQLRRLLVETGLEHADIKVFPIQCKSLRVAEELGFLPDDLAAQAIENGAITLEEWRSLNKSLNEYDHRGVFFLTSNLMLASAYKPEND